MKVNMTSLLILIREPENSRQVVDGIAAAICPYLGTFSEQATIATIERLREFEAGEPNGRVTQLRISLAGLARLPSATLVSKLERFLKQAAKDAEMAIKFELLHVESTESDAASK